MLAGAHGSPSSGTEAAYTPPTPAEKLTDLAQHLREITVEAESLFDEEMDPDKLNKKLDRDFERMVASLKRSSRILRQLIFEEREVLEPVIADLERDLLACRDLTPRAPETTQMCIGELGDQMAHLRSELHRVAKAEQATPQ